MAHLHIIAQNFATAIEEIHHKGYVIGDIKPQNILVPVDSLYISIIDTDSFQIRNHNTGKIYRSPVSTPEYTPPELHGKDFKTIDRLEIHDRFGLGVIIHLLLFGEHPFAGKLDKNYKEEDLSNIDVRISQGYWSNGLDSLISKRELAIPLEITHPTIQECFHKCFTLGHENPHLRPSARDWRQALELARKQLVKCSIVNSHRYDNTYGKCYWCEVKNQIDYFPPIETDKKDTTPPLEVTSPVFTLPPRVTSPVAKTSTTVKPTSSSSKSKVTHITGFQATLIATVCGLGILIGVPPMKENITQPILNSIMELFDSK